MSKLILQGLLSLFISLGVIVGVNPNARSEVKQVWQETKAAVHQTAEYVADRASSAVSQIDANANVQAGADANSNTSLSGASNGAHTGAEVDSQTNGSAGTGGNFLLNLGNSTGFNLDFNFWK